MRSSWQCTNSHCLEPAPINISLFHLICFFFVFPASVFSNSFIIFNHTRIWDINTTCSMFVVLIMRINYYFIPTIIIIWKNRTLNAYMCVLLDVLMMLNKCKYSTCDLTWFLPLKIWIPNLKIHFHSMHKIF